MASQNLSKVQRFRASSPLRSLDLAQSACVFILAAALLTMAGWLLKSPLLVHYFVFPHPIPFNVAAGLFVFSLSAMGILRGRSFEALFGGGFLVLLGALTLLQYINGKDLGIDQLIVKAWASSPDAAPGRMTAGGAYCLVLAGLGLWALIFKRRHPTWALVPGLLGSVIIALSTVAFGSFLFGLDLDYGWDGHGQLPQQGVILYALLGLVLVTASMRKARSLGFSAHWFTPWFCAGGMLITTGFLWLGFLQAEVKAIHHANKSNAERKAAFVAANLDIAVKSLGRMARRLKNGAFHSEQQWQLDASGYLKDFPGLQAIGFIDKTGIIKWVEPGSAKEKIAGSATFRSIDWQQKSKSPDSILKFTDTSIDEAPESGAEDIWILSPLSGGRKFDGVLVSLIDMSEFLSFIEPRQDFALKITGNGRTLLEIGIPAKESRGAATAKVPYQQVEWQVHSFSTEAGLEAQRTALPRVILLFGISITVLFLIASHLRLRALEKARRASLLNERLSKLMQVAPVGIFHYDKEQGCTFVSDFWCQLTGLKKEEAVGSGWKRVIHPEDQEFIFSEWQRCVDSGQEFSEMFRMLDTRGNTLWVKATTAFIHNDEGKDSGIIGTIQDFTRQKLAEDELRDNHRFLQTVLDTLPVALFCKDATKDYRFSLWNKRAESLWGFKDSDVIGKTDFDLFPLREARRFRLDDEEVMEGAAIVDIPEEIVQTQDNGPVIVHTTKTPVHDSQGKPRFLLGISQDITDRKQIEKVLEQQRTQIHHAEKMSALGEMAGGMAHEINNPLAALELCAGRILEELEEESADKEVLERNAKRISATVERIAKIIKGLRSFARDGEQDPFAEVPIKDIISETLDFCHARFGNYNVELRLGDIPADLTLECRSTQISQIILNLLNNAFDAVRPLSKAWVELTVEDLGECVEIRITDSGTGITPEVAENIMKPFFTTKPAGKGTGLGLSISQVIVQAHMGSLVLDLDSPTTSFVMKLPKKQKQERKAA